MASPRAAERAPYLPFDGGRFRLAMGLMPLRPEHWLELDDDHAAHLAEKRALLTARPSEVFAALPEAAEASAELLSVLAQHLPQHHPDRFERAGDLLVNRTTGERWDVTHPPLHPLDLAGRLVQEDFCVMRAGEHGYILAGATLCAPARWSLADKLGRPLGAVHAPVPGYARALEAPVDRFFAVLKPDRIVWRLNWSLIDDPTRFQPVARPPDGLITAATAGKRLWLRVERQTLRRLPWSGAVIFTIRTHITRLDAAITAPTQAADLAAALREMPPETQRYKQIAPVAEALLAWLEARSG